MVRPPPPGLLPTDTGNQHHLFTPPPPQPESSEMVKRMIVSFSGDGSLPPDTLEHLTPELLTRIEPSLITAAIATRKTQVKACSIRGIVARVQHCIEAMSWIDLALSYFSQCKLSE